MPRIPVLDALVPKGDGRTVRPELKRADPFYHSTGHEQFREILKRAGYRCEWIEDGKRYTKSAPQHRLFADHIKERRDGGDPTDPSNGMCLCGSHHTIKTQRERARRLASNGGEGVKFPSPQGSSDRMGSHARIFFIMGENRRSMTCSATRFPTIGASEGVRSIHRRRKNRNRVSMLVALGWSNTRIAAALYITVPTLRKHYFSELKFREVAHDRLMTGVAMKLWEGVQAGSVSAIRAFRDFVDRNDLMIYGHTAKPVEPAKVAKPEKLGKKEAAARAAQNPDRGSVLGDLNAQRQGLPN